MARTRGGGVIRGASAQPRRRVGNPRVAGMRGGRFPVLPRPPQVLMHSSTETAAIGAAAEQYPGSNTAAAQPATSPLLLSPLPGGGHTFPPQIGDDLATGDHHVMGGSSPSAMGMPGVSAFEAAGDVNAALGPDLAFVFDGELGDGSIGIHDNLENTFVENSIAEDAVGRPQIELLEEDTCSAPLNNADQSASQRLATTARRKSPLSPPKVVWRMLYVDPDSDNPRRDARTLESAASEALRCACVFDVATDIVEALADLHDGTMWVYRGVFVNETLMRHRKDRSKTSIEGKHLARFLREVGMLRTRMVLLVAGGVDFDTADAGAHGLSAVLRKPFTKNGFCNILRGMYLGSDPTADSSEPTADAEAVLPPVPTPVQASFPGQNPYATKRLRGPEGAPLAAAAASAASAASAAAAAAAAMHVGRPPALTRPPPSYPACLGFTPFSPFAHPMIGAYSLGTGFLRPGQAPAGPQRKYTKIAPRELGEAVDLLGPPVEGNDRAVRAAAETSSVPVDVDHRAGAQGVLPCSAGAEGLGTGRGEASGETKIGPRGGDNYASGAPELPLLPASSVDDVLSGAPTSASGSTEAAAVESAAVLKPEAR